MAASTAPDRTLNAEQASWMLRRMMEIRRFEERVIEIYPSDQMVTPVHLHIGQEAVPVGLCANLKAQDTLFFTHRTHGPALAKGLEIKSLMAELFGRTTGCAGGIGGSMHLVDPDNGMLGSSAIVGGAISLGVGSALAAKLTGQDRVAVSFFGDAACDSGAFWESINFAALKSVPVLLVCENNGLSNTMRYDEHMFANVAKVASNFMPAWEVDGTNAVEMFAHAREALKHVRGEKKPAFLLCNTKRWMRHQGPEVDDLEFNPIDREKDCPIIKLKKLMLSSGWIDDAGINKMYQETCSRIEAAIEFSKASPFPDESELLEEV